MQLKITKNFKENTFSARTLPSIDGGRPSAPLFTPKKPPLSRKAKIVMKTINSPNYSTRNIN